MSRVIATHDDAVMTFSGPPADRMAGRPSRTQGAVKATKPRKEVSAATAARANQFLEREDLLDQAIHDGRINAGMRDYYAQCFNADPAGTRAFLGSMAHAAPPAAQAQTSAGAPEDYPESMLTSAERAAVAAAREGKKATGVIHGGL